MRTIVGHCVNLGVIDWEDMGHADDGTDALVVSFPRVPGQRREALRVVAADLLRSKTDWFRLERNAWRVDLAGLRAAFRLAYGWEWLAGDVAVEPEHDASDCAIGSHPIVRIVLERATIEHQLDRPERVRERMFDLRSFHPPVAAVSRTLFVDGHIRQAVLDACLALNARVQGAAGRTDLDGRALVSEAFSPKKPLVAFNALTTDSDRSEQEGLMFLFMGLGAAVRNPNAHGLRSHPDPAQALEILGLVSWLWRRLDEAPPHP